MRGRDEEYQTLRDKRMEQKKKIQTRKRERENGRIRREERWAF